MCNRENQTIGEDQVFFGSQRPARRQDNDGDTVKAGKLSNGGEG